MVNIFVEIATKFGVKKTCEIKIKQGAPLQIEIKCPDFGFLHFEDNNLFAALSQFRLFLEKNGYLLLCNAARKDAYPSRMTLQMGGGRKIYILKMGVPAKFENLVNIFDFAPIENVCTVSEQRMLRSPQIL